MYDVTPHTALEEYLEDKQQDCSKATVQSHKSRLSHFVSWCDSEEIEHLSNVDGRDLHQFRLWRRDDGDLEAVSEATQMSTLRVFLSWCERLEYVEDDLSRRVRSPSDAKATRDELVAREKQEKIEEWYRTYDYASAEHATVRLLMLGLRTGGIRTLDLRDFDRNDRTLEVQHRPETETPIKKAEDGERILSLSPETTEILAEFVENRRNDITDAHGREPLLTSARSRPHPQTVRKWSYRATQPCKYSNTCPHNRDIESCDATSYSNAHECPSSSSPHTWRRGVITHLLNQDAPERLVVERCDVDASTLRDHYDARTSREKMEARRDWLDNIE